MRISDEKISERILAARTHSPDDKVVRIRTEGKGIGVLKTLFVGLLILVQLGFILLVYLGILNEFRWYLLVAFAFSFISCLHVLSSNKTGQTKTVWVLFLILFSSFGYIAYMLSSEDIFFGWAKRRYKKIFARTAQFTPEYIEVSGVSDAVKSDTEYLFNAGGFAPYTNSKLKYFPSGAQLFDDVLEKLKTAEKFVFIEYFIISDGVLLSKFFNILSRKAAEGVDVRIICDGMGSHGTLSWRMRKRMKRAGIKLMRFNRIVPRFTFALNVRDHRKIVVIDGKTAYTGGCNLADEYVNEKRMHGYWKDTGLRCEGKAVDGFTLIFLRQWEFITRKAEDYSPYLISEGVEGDSVVVPYADGKDFKSDIGKDAYNNVMAGAQKRLYVMTPYFVPDEDTMNLFARKARSGVDVRIILPDVPDKSYVFRVTLDNAERLLASGVKVYRMRHAFVHSKVMLSENCAAVGSVNIDLRSFYNQFENAVYTNDGSVMEEVLLDFESTFKACAEVTEKTATRQKLILRVLAVILRLFSPLM